MSAVHPAVRNSVASIVLVALATVFLVYTVLPAANRLSNGFLAYYVGGLIIKSGESAASLYDDASFSARVRQVSAGQITDIFLANPPVTAVAWVPLAYLTVEQARKLWVACSVLCLAVAIGLIARQFGESLALPHLAALTAIFTLAAPAREQFLLGQMYALLLLLHTIGWQAFTRKQDALAGFALGLALALKLSGWPIGLLFIARRRWTAVWTSAVTALCAAAVTLPWVGLDAWRVFWLNAVPQALRRPSATLTVYQDTAGFWQHWLRFDARLNPHALLDAPMIATLLTSVTTLIACFALVARPRPDHLSFAAAIALAELLSPAAEQYHYLVVLLPLAVLWREAWLLRSSHALCAAGIATLLIAFPISYKAPHPAWALPLLYPRLIGGWICFSALLVPWRDQRQNAVTKGALQQP